MACTIAVALGAVRAGAATDVRWANPVDGNWMEAGKWAGGVVPDNGEIPTGFYRAIIDAAGGTYTVALNNTVRLDALRLDAPGATLAHTAGTLTVDRGFDVVTGSYVLGGGTLVLTNLSGALGNVTLGAGSRWEVYGESTGGMSNTVARSVSNGASLLFGGKWTNTAPITVDGGTLELKDRGTNSAAITVGNGSTLILGGFASLDDPSPTLGNIAVTDSQVRITGRYRAAQLAGVSFTNAAVTLTGAINNLSTDALTLPAGAGVWTLDGGAINGTINGGVGTGLRVVGTKHSELAGALNVPLTVLAGATVDSQVLTGSPAVTNDGTLNVRNNGNVTFAGGWHNGGAVVVDNSTLTLTAPGVGALGTFETRNGGTLALTGNFKASEVRTIVGATSGTGTFLLGGGAVVDNTGDTLDLSATAHAWGANGATVVGGTITSTGGKALTVGGGTAVTNLDGVTLGAPVQMNGTLRLTNGLTLSNVVVSVSGRVGPSPLLLNGSQTIGGTGEIRFDGGLGSVLMDVSSVNDVITIGPGVSVRATKVFGAMGGFPLVNQGTIRSETNGAGIQIGGGVGTSITNDGLLEAVTRGSLNVACPISGTGTVSVGALSTATLTRGRQGAVLVGGMVALRTKAQGGGTLKVGDLAIAGGSGAWTGKVDLADNALVVDYSGATVLGRTVDQLRSGRAGGAWTGNGIMTSKAGTTGALGYAEASDLLGLTGAQTATWLGETVDATAVLVRYTVAGDATLDGVVNFDDLLALAKHYNAVGDAATWGAGDFDYSGGVNFDDLLVLAKNYNKVAATPAVPGAGVGFNAEVAAAFAEAAVPEPGVGLMVGAGVVLGVRRRRRD